VVANGGWTTDLRKRQLSTLASALKATGLWQAGYDFAMLAAENQAQALTTLKRRTLMTSVNAATFTTDRGFTPNGTSSYINTNTVLPQVASVRLSVYERSSLAATTSTYALGVAETSPNVLAIRPLTAASTCSVNLLSGGGTLTTDAVSKGLTVGSKDASHNMSLYKNGALTGTVVAGSSAIVPMTLPIFLGARNNMGVADGFRNSSLAYADFGDIIPGAQEAPSADAIIAHLAAIGASVA
jgi:hypothetical protein